MKILILNPPAKHTVIENPDAEGREFLESDDFGDFPPLGALYVLTYCEKHTVGHQFFFIDGVGERLSHEALRQRVAEIAPDVVGITSFTVSLVDVCLAARNVRQVCPKAHICLGGHHPIAFPAEAAQLPEFDSIVVGEGEIAFTELVKTLGEGADITNILGVYTRESIKAWEGRDFRDKRFLARVTVPSAYVEDIDTIPPPNRNYIRHIKYRNILGVTPDLATVLSSRGCPYQCTFCDVPIKSYRQRAVENVLDEIQECLAMGYTEIRFYDDLFNITEQKVLEFCDAIERRKLNFVWDFRGRVNAVTYESLRRAKQVGLRMISFGVETGNDAGLKSLKKGTTTKQILNAFTWCRQLGIETVADFIIGLPSEKTPKDVMDNISFMNRLDPDYAQISVLTLYPNTELYDQAVDKGLAEPGRWSAWTLNPTAGFIVDHWEEHMPHALLTKLQKRAYRRFYFRPRYVLRSIAKTRSLYEFKAKLMGVSKLLQLNHRST